MFSIRGDGLVTIAAGGLDVSGGATILTTSTGVASDSALSVEASDASYQGTVLQILSAASSASTFYLVKVCLSDV